MVRLLLACLALVSAASAHPGVGGFQPELQAGGAAVMGTNPSHPPPAGQLSPCRSCIITCEERNNHLESHNSGDFCISYCLSIQTCKDEDAFQSGEDKLPPEEEQEFPPGGGVLPSGVDALISGLPSGADQCPPGVPSFHSIDCHSCIKTCLEDHNCRDSCIATCQENHECMDEDLFQINLIPAGGDEFPAGGDEFPSGVDALMSGLQSGAGQCPPGDPSCFSNDLEQLPSPCRSCIITCLEHHTCSPWSDQLGGDLDSFDQHNYDQNKYDQHNYDPHNYDQHYYDQHNYDQLN